MKYSTRIIGHRGASGTALENTAGAFQAAVEAGVDVIETDVHLSSDGHVVIAHDAGFARLGGPDRPLRAVPRSEIAQYRLEDGSARGARPLFMDEALKMFPQASFNVDLKEAGRPLVEAWARMLADPSVAGRCRTVSFHDSSLRMLRRLKPECRIAPGRFGAIRLTAGALLGRVRRPGKGEGVLQIPFINRRMLTVLHRCGWEVEVWTIDEPEKMEELIRMGVDGIMTNFPLVLKDVLTRLNAEAGP